ncbi:phage tail protein [Vibrio alginolyticus]|uniref:phage tail protein n=1 Tax=Vibrio alginolyticus TaxID=663 RepID=UPI00124DD78A|nr:phage tail protein [Vibrio alginolyticus]KAB2116637.1 phage tail protein [Vibrio alginolyticus]
MPKFEKLDNGAFDSSGLTAKKFNQLFNQIEKAQKKSRRNAKRTLNRGTFNNPTSKALKALGEKAKGMGFTKSDLEAFDKSRKGVAKKYDARTAGIVYAFLVKNSRQVDIDRSNNRVDDGTGVQWANLKGIKGNELIMSVDASQVSKHQHHRVKARLEEWDDYMASPPDGDYAKAVKAACAGRISIDCDCGRHQYWYRYIATMGNYQIKPPAEFSFPKIRNPELAGVACKHILRATRMMQTPSIQRQLVKEMKRQADKVGFGSDNRTQFIDEKTQAQIRRANRGKQTDRNKADRDFAKYQKAQKALDRKLAAQGKTSDKVKRQARRLRKQQNQLTQMKDMIVFGFNSFADGYKAQGKTKAQAINDYAKQLNVTPSRLKGLLK